MTIAQGWLCPVCQSAHPPTVLTCPNTIVKAKTCGACELPTEKTPDVGGCACPRPMG